MFCKECGAQLKEDARFCEKCGANNTLREQPVNNQVSQSSFENTTYQQPTYQQLPPQQNNYQQLPPQQPVYQQPAYGKPQQPAQGLAIASMICGIVSLICFAIITGPLGIIFGAVAKSKGNRGGMATAGIVCGAIGIGLWVLLMIGSSALSRSFSDLSYYYNM